MRSRNPAGPSRPGAPPKGERRRRLILSAARDHFLARGFSATTIDDIVGRAGGSKTSVYAAFGSKEGLFEALMAELATAAEARAALERIDPGVPLREALARFGASALLLLTSRDAVDLLRLTLAEAERFPGLGRAYWRSGPATLEATLAAHLASARRLRPAPAEEAAREFMALLEGGAVLRLALGLDPPPDAVRAAAEGARAAAAFCRLRGWDEG